MIDFFEVSNEMLCVADHRGYFVRVNQAWSKTLGWSIDELTASPYIDFVHPDDVGATIREASLLWSGKHETIHFENRYRSRNGAYRWLAWQAMLDQESQQLVATARDVTDDKVQAEALLESEQRFRLLANNAPIGIAQSDAEGSIFFVNSKWCEIAGVTQQEAMGFQWKSLVHPDDLEVCINHWLSYLQAGHDMPAYEFRFKHRNGDIRWASSSVAMLKDPAGKVIGQIATIQDITKRKTAEDTLRETEERFRVFTDNSPTVAWAKDEVGRVVYINRTAEEVFQLAVRWTPKSGPRSGPVKREGQRPASPLPKGSRGRGS